MTPTMEEVAGWHRELSGWFMSIANMSGMACTNDLNRKRAKLWEDRAAQVEAMGMPKTCRTCSSYAEYYEPVTNYNRQTNTCLDGYAHGKGPRFGCIHHKETPQPPVKK